MVHSQRQQRQSRVLLAFGLLFLVIGSIGAIGCWGAYLRDSEIARTGTTVQARIAKKSVLHDAAEGNDFEVAYGFELPDGQRVQGRANLPKRIWTPLRVGDPIQVIYSPANPARNFPQSGGVTSMAFAVFASAFFGLFAVTGAAFLFSYFRPLRRIESGSM